MPLSRQDSGKSPLELGQHTGCRLAFPNDDHRPARPAKMSCHKPISANIVAKLLLPTDGCSSRNSGSSCTSMPVPKAPVDKEDGLSVMYYEVWLSEERLEMPSKANIELLQHRGNGFFASASRGPNARHPLAPLGLRQGVDTSRG